MYLNNTESENFEKKENLSFKRDLICFSHLRWDFVFQRPQHLLLRFARNFRVWYIEEPVYLSDKQPHYVLHRRRDGITVITPYLPEGMTADEDLRLQIELFDNFMTHRSLEATTFWYYTPMALPFTRQYKPAVTVYDCMDELSAFKFAPVALKLLEKELLRKADIVFTGGCSLFEAKKGQHDNIHAFPSSINKEHFSAVRSIRNRSNTDCSKDRLTIGFYGVIDERFDIELIREIALLRPEWKIILIGPVVKIDAATLPVLDNISYLGSKTYDELPEYIATWDIALIPFLLNEATRFISPTKTPEYLAAGIPVISTPIKDVITPYGDLGLVSIGNNAAEFVALAGYETHRDRVKWLRDVDRFLSGNSWDLTVSKMQLHINSVLQDGTLSENETDQKYV